MAQDDLSSYGINYFVDAYPEDMVHLPDEW